MTIGKSVLRSASVLTTASAVFWIGMACAAPPPPQYAGNPAALFAPVMQDPAEVADGNVVLAANLRRQLVGYPTIDRELRSVDSLATNERDGKGIRTMSRPDVGGFRANLFHLRLV